MNENQKFFLCFFLVIILRIYDKNFKSFRPKLQKRQFMTWRTLNICEVAKKTKKIHIALQNFRNLAKIIFDQKSLVTINETSYKYKQQSGN